jgi:hypothetical protein
VIVISPDTFPVALEDELAISHDEKAPDVMRSFIQRGIESQQGLGVWPGFRCRCRREIFSYRRRAAPAVGTRRHCVAWQPESRHARANHRALQSLLPTFHAASPEAF